MLSWGAFGTSIFVGEKPGGRRGSATVPFERAMSDGFLNCDRCAICNHSAAVCHRMSLTLKSTVEWVTLGQNLARKGKTDVSTFLRDLGERHGAVVCNRNRVNIFYRLSTMHERVRQTDTQTDDETVTWSPF